EKGKREVIAVDTKMRAETEMSYEPSLLVELERSPRGVSERGWIHRATVVKDRWNVMDGEKIDNPVFASFLPVIERLNIGGEHVGGDSSRTSEHLFTSPGRSRNEWHPRGQHSLSTC